MVLKSSFSLLVPHLKMCLAGGILPEVPSRIRVGGGPQDWHRCVHRACAFSDLSVDCERLSRVALYKFGSNETISPVEVTAMVFRYLQKTASDFAERQVRN